MHTDVTKISFAKGHGTENDFVLILDTEGKVVLTPDTVKRLCNRRAGVGGDGLIRVIRNAALDPEESPSFGDQSPAWFMDYRNADGSLAVMCGNGLRVMVAYLEKCGLVTLEEGEEVAIATRSGVKTVRRLGPQYSIDLGAWSIIVGDTDGAEDRPQVEVPLPGHSMEPIFMSGLRVSIGNPHVVVALPNMDALRQLDLSRAPTVSPNQPDGINVEFVVVGPSCHSNIGRLAMRVHERGTGETRSCGTGAAAAALAVRYKRRNLSTPNNWRIDVRGGTLNVAVTPDDFASGSNIQLIGPAVVVATGVLELAAIHEAIDS